MRSYASLLITAFGLFSTLQLGSAATVCEKETFFGVTTYFNCPGPTDSREDEFCCGTKENRYCCDSPFGVDDETLKAITEQLPVILGVVGALILGLIVLCIICCCCCPFCLLAKRRNRGAVHQPASADVTVTQPLQQMQPYPGQQQQYPGQQQPYPAQGYPPQQGYAPQPQYMPQQPYPPQGYPAQPYPPQGNPAVYPVDQPPPYSEKQLPYNPEYQE